MSDQPVIRILLADDQEMIRQGLQVLLELQPDLRVVAQAGNGSDALSLALRLKPDVVLMDIKMPVMDGIEATRRICREAQDINVIILTTYDTDDWVFAGLRAGARGYLLKDAGGDAMIEAVRGVMRGESQLDPGIARKVVDEFRRAAPPAAREEQGADARFESLTEREQSVLDEIALGLNNRDIAAKLHLTEGTVRNYVSSIMTKLHANDRTQALVKAARRGMVRL